MEQANNLTMYPTKSPVVYGMVNGRMMGVQLTAISDPEQASKFLALYEKQQKLQKAGKQDGQESQTPTSKESDTPAEDQELPREDPLERVKKLVEQGFGIVQPVIGPVLREGRFIDPDQRVEFVPIKDFIDPRVAELQPVPQAPLEVMSTGPIPMVQTQNVEIPVTDDAVEQMVQTPVPAEEVPAEEIQVVKQQAAEEIVPQEQDDDQAETEISDVEQAPQQIFHDVEAAPIKVGESYHTEQSEAPDLTDQLSGQLAQAISQGESRVEIQLTPETLGSVKVEIVQTQEGGIRVSISAESSQTRNLLEKHSNSLQMMLAGRSQGPVQVEVQRQQESQRQDNHPYDGHNGQGQQQQQRQHRPRQEQEAGDFLQQFRLGLIPMQEDEES